MDIFDSTDRAALSTLPDETSFRSFLDKCPSGITMIAEKYRDCDSLILKPDTGDFAKWIRATEPAMKVNVEAADRLILRSSDLWLPLAYLAQDITLPIYLNLVSNYIFEKAKGMLKGESCRVHMSVTFEDKNKGVIKNFSFDGDSDALAKAVKQFDLNRFLE